MSSGPFGGSVVADREPYFDLPDDVCDWLDDTYDEEGVGIWLHAYIKADQAGRERMVRIARTPSGGT